MRNLPVLQNLLLSSLLLAGSARADYVKLTIVSAKIDPQFNTDGGRPHTTGSLSDLTCQSEPGLRKLATMCGGAARPAGLAAIDPFVGIELASRSIRTYPIPGTLTPAWDYSVVIDPDDTDDTEAPRIVLFDHSDTKDLRLGTKTIKFKDLFAPGTHTATAVGGKSEVTWRVEAVAKNAAPRTYDLHILGTKQMNEQARDAVVGPGGKDKYVLIPVAEGELVDVTATGKVQPSAVKHPNLSTGPGGLLTVQTKIQFNQPGFRGCPGCNHAALIAQLGAEGIVIGEKSSFAAKSSGYLLFGVNDVRVSDNAGAYDATVTIKSPVQRGIGPDPRVVEMAFDSHMPEIEACEAAGGSPTGHLTMDFVISADGRLIGIVLNNVSEKMAPVADCIHLKANNWVFPPGTAGAIGSYPLSFSAE